MNTPGRASIIRAGAKLEDRAGAPTAGARAWRGWCFEAAEATVAAVTSATAVAMANAYLIGMLPQNDTTHDSTGPKNRRSRSGQFGCCRLPRPELPAASHNAVLAHSFGLVRRHPAQRFEQNLGVLAACVEAR